MDDSSSSSGLRLSKKDKTVQGSSHQSSQPQPRQQEKLRRKKGGSGSGMIVTWLIFILLVGCLQIVFFHHGTGLLHEQHEQHQQSLQFEIERFDRNKWKAENFVQDDVTNTTTTTSITASGKTRNPNPILAILEEAGLSTNLSSDDATLPSWASLTSLYGSLQEPVIIGMDTCEQYRQLVPLERRYTSVAGLFNTGTNAMAFHLRKNVPLPTAWQVPWGKHRMPFVRLNHTAPGSERHNRLEIMPIILIRDPFHWMQSMCKNPYAAHWRSRKEHCPNLVPDSADREHYHNLNEANATFKVRVDFDKDQVFYWDSLVHLWNDWYGRYLRDTDYPRLMVRFEDMLIHGPTIMKLIANCTGVPEPTVFHHQTESAKSHGSHSTFLSALNKTGNAVARIHQMTSSDLEYCQYYLDRDLMQTFQYTQPKTTANNRSTSTT